MSRRCSRVSISWSRSAATAPCCALRAWESCMESRCCRIEIYDARLTSYHADGVIVSTATGSTAYALAAGGPIIDPRSRALALVPIAAHLTNLPSLVLHEDAVITLTLRSRHQAAFSADGRESVPLQEGDVVEVRRSAQVCVFARVHPPSTFYERLTQRLRREG